jgi:hypothetical protein
MAERMAFQLPHCWLEEKAERPVSFADVSLEPVFQIPEQAEGIHS